MYYIRQAGENDISTVYNFTSNLVQYHENMTEYFILNEEGMLSAFKSSAFQCLILFEKITDQEEAVGYLLYVNEYSFLHGNGYFIDDFFVFSRLRGKGLGKMLMHHLYKLAVDNSVNFVKLSFQKSILGLEKLYTGLGFVNITTPEKGLSIYELFGAKEIQAFLKASKSGDGKIEETNDGNDFFFIIKRQEKGIS